VLSRPPGAPTCAVLASDLEQPDINERLSGMYDRAIVRYQLVDGTSGSVTVSKPHPRAVQDTGTALTVDAGLVGSVAIAEVVGLYQLSLAQIDSRAAGSVVLPERVMTDSGSRLSSTLQAGRDRIRIVGLPRDATLLADLSQSADSFRISRVDVVETAGGSKTTVGIDAGADLIEVLQARLSNAVFMAEST
jgi:hypothetical protein